MLVQLLATLRDVTIEEEPTCAAPPKRPEIQKN
jgi:hypothetical protein